MKSSWHDIWGSARGPASGLTPQARIMCGLFLMTGCMAADPTRVSGLSLLAVVCAAWIFACRPPLKVLSATFTLGLVLFVPYFLLFPLMETSSKDPGFLETLHVPLKILARGISSMLICVTTITTLSPGALRQGLARLPVPEFVSAVLIQIVHQTFNLIYETRRLSAAVAVRGGTRGFGAGLRLARSLPTIWIPRIMDRADRVACAMELRGYCSREPGTDRSRANRAHDYLTLALCAAALPGTIVLRVTGAL